MHAEEMTSNNSLRRKVVDKEKWKNFIEEWKESNESQKVFCDRLGISIHTFVYMRGKFLQKENKSNASKFIPVTVKDTNIEGELKEIILENMNGIKIKLPIAINSEKLKQLLMLLGWSHA